MLTLRLASDIPHHFHGRVFRTHRFLPYEMSSIRPKGADGRHGVHESANVDLPSEEDVATLVVAFDVGDGIAHWDLVICSNIQNWVNGLSLRNVTQIPRGLIETSRSKCLW